MSTARAAWQRLSATDPRVVLACLCLVSLALRSERYPVLVQVGSAELRLQDGLFGLLIVASMPLAIRWVRRNRVIATATGIFFLLIGVAALRSPVGDPAIVAVGKYVEFVLAGAAIALNIRRLDSAWPFTWAFVGATSLNLAVAVGQSLAGAGPGGLVTLRTSGLLGLESAAALAIMTMVWCLARMSRAGEAERRGAIMGVGAALLLLLLAKSVLAAAALLALAVLSKNVASTFAYRAVAFGTVLVLVLILTVGRHADLRSATVGTAVPTVGSSVPKLEPSSDEPWRPQHVPPRYTIRQPGRVTGGSFVHRVALGYVGARIALDSPLLGRGWQSTTSSDFLQQGPYDRYMVERFPDLDPQLFVSSLPNGPHNAYIQLIAEAGWTAMLALVVAMLAALVPGFVAIRRGRTDSWYTAVGAAWVAVVAAFLMSSSLFGGQFESSMLGAAIVLGAPAGGLAAVPTRIWTAAAAVLLAVAAAAAAALFVPASDANGQPIARVRALSQLGHGQELFRRGVVPVQERVVLDNGLVQARLGERMLTLASRTVDPGRPMMLALAPPTRIARQVITHREADIVSIEGRDAGDRPVVKLALRRGIPGAFVEIARGESLGTSSRGALLRGPDLGTSTFPTQRPLGTSSLRGGSRAALVPSATGMVVAILGDPPRPDARARGERFLIGILPRPRPNADTTRPKGGYMVVPRGREAQTLIVREARIARRREDLVVPYLLDDRERSGLAELLGFNAAYGRRLGPLP